jgi:hypothetical protein
VAGEQAGVRGEQEGVEEGECVCQDCDAVA